MSSRQEDIKNRKEEIDKYTAALLNQSAHFGEGDVCRLTQNLPTIATQEGLAKSGSVNFLKPWIAIGFKVTRTMVEIATEHGNLAFLKECFADNSIECDLKWIRAMEEKKKNKHAHIQEWLDGLESQP